MRPIKALLWVTLLYRQINKQSGQNNSFFCSINYNFFKKSVAPKQNNRLDINLLFKLLIYLILLPWVIKLCYICYQTALAEVDSACWRRNDQVHFRTRPYKSFQIWQCNKRVKMVKKVNKIVHKKEPNPILFASKWKNDLFLVLYLLYKKKSSSSYCF